MEKTDNLNDLSTKTCISVDKGGHLRIGAKKRRKLVKCCKCEI